MKNIKVVFFDLYKTLIFLPFDINPYKSFFKNANIKNKDKLLEAKKLVLTEEFTSLYSLAEKLETETVDSISEIEKIITKEVDNAQMFKDVFPAIKQLKQKKVRVCIISNLANPYKKPVYTLGLNDVVDELIFSCEQGCKKPEKQIFHLACNRMNIEPCQGLMVGDSLTSDYVGAIGSGMNALLLNRNAHNVNVPNIITLDELSKCI